MTTTNPNMTIRAEIAHPRTTLARLVELRRFADAQRMLATDSDACDMWAEIAAEAAAAHRAHMDRGARAMADLIAYTDH